jgi:hypothetical protein
MILLFKTCLNQAQKKQNASICIRLHKVGFARTIFKLCYVVVYLNIKGCSGLNRCNPFLFDFKQKLYFKKINTFCLKICLNQAQKEKNASICIRLYKVGFARTIFKLCYVVVYLNIKGCSVLNRCNPLYFLSVHNYFSNSGLSITLAAVIVRWSFSFTFLSL